MDLERFVSRSDLGWPTTPALKSNTNQGMVAHYDSADEYLYEKDHVTPKEHAACTAYWRRTRNMHMFSNGWVDVGYAYFVCPHDYIYAGREYGRVQAAQAPTPGKQQNGNTRYVAVTFGTGPHEHPNASQINAWRRLRAYLMDVKDVDASVFGHRDFTSTSCPGNVIYDLVADGTLSGTVKIETGSFEVSKLPTLSRGSTGYDVLTLRALLFQRFLSARMTEMVYEWLRRNDFDEELKVEVIAFQTWKKLVPDGVVGPKTWSKLLRLG